MADIIVTTDAQGKASVEVVPGKYVVDVTPPAGYRDAPDQEVILFDGDVKQAAFLLEPQRARAEMVVVDAAGLPLSGVEIRIRLV